MILARRRRVKRAGSFVANRRLTLPSVEPQRGHCSDVAFEAEL
jgi:hypothetical protein